VQLFSDSGDVCVTKLNFSAIGLDEKADALLARQLKIVTPWLTAEWSMNAEPEASDFILTTSKSLLPSSFQGVSVLLLEKLSDDDHDMVAELPLRVFSLMDILNKAGERITNDLSAIPEVSAESIVTASEKTTEKISFSCAEWLSQRMLEKVACFYIAKDKGASFSFDPVKKVFRSNIESRDELIKLLLMHPVEHWDIRADDETSEAYEFSATGLLWLLALKESRYALHVWGSPNRVYRIKHWPQLAAWENVPALYKLSSLYGRKAATIDTGVKISGLEERHVCAFLHACNVVGLKVEVCDSETADRLQPSVQSLNILQALKKKLGV